MFKELINKIKEEFDVRAETKKQLKKECANIYFNSNKPLPKTRYEFAYENGLVDCEEVMDGEFGAYTNYLEDFYKDYYKNMKKQVKKDYKEYKKAIDELNRSFDQEDKGIKDKALDVACFVGHYGTLGVGVGLLFVNPVLGVSLLAGSVGFGAVRKIRRYNNDENYIESNNSNDKVKMENISLWKELANKFGKTNNKEKSKKEFLSFFNRFKKDKDQDQTQDNEILDNAAWESINVDDNDFNDSTNVIFDLNAPEEDTNKGLFSFFRGFKKDEIEKNDDNIYRLTRASNISDRVDFGTSKYPRSPKKLSVNERLFIEQENVRQLIRNEVNRIMDDLTNDKQLPAVVHKQTPAVVYQKIFK